MPRIICNYENCKYVDDGHCGSAAVEIDPFEGCMTFLEVGVMVTEGVLKDDAELLDEGWDDLGFDEEDDSWLDDNL